jgi:hypothetical protein
LRNLKSCQRYKSIDEGDTGDFTCDDHISPQVPFLSIGLIGSLIIESQGQFCNGLGASNVDSPVCNCNSLNSSLSAQCLDCENLTNVKVLVQGRALKKRSMETKLNSSEIQVPQPPSHLT